MANLESVTDWLVQLKQGHSSAAGRLWHEYVERLVRLARQRLRGCARRVTDEEDVALSVFKAFLNGVGDRRFVKLDDSDDLWQVLVMLTERKAIATFRREQAGIRGDGQVRGESIFKAGGGSAVGQAGLDGWAGSEPTPAFAAEMTEELERRLESLKDPVQREVAIGKLQGCTHEELAEKLNVSLRTVERKLRLIRLEWSQDL